MADGEGSGGWLSSLFSERTTLVVAVLIFSGYIYIESYLGYFGLSTFDANVSPSAFIYYSLKPLLGIFSAFFRGAGLVVVATALISAAGWYALKRWPRLRPATNAFVLAMAFSSAYAVARVTAFADALAVSRGDGTRIEFTLDEDDIFHVEALRSESTEAPTNGRGREISRGDQIENELWEANEDGALRLVWRTPTYVAAAAHYPNAFRRCTQGGPGVRKPHYCSYSPERTQVPEVYVLRTDDLGIQRATHRALLAPSDRERAEN